MFCDSRAGPTQVLKKSFRKRLIDVVDHFAVFVLLVLGNDGNISPSTRFLPVIDKGFIDKAGRFLVFC